MLLLVRGLHDGLRYHREMPLALIGGTAGAVLIEDDKIAAIGDVELPPDVEKLDCSGLTITAGFHNNHVHFFERKWSDAATIPAPELARQLRDTFLRFGFTTVFDLGSDAANTRIIRERIESGEVDGPRIFTTGAGLVPKGMMPPDVVLNLMGVMKFPFPEIANAADAIAAVRTLLADGVDAIKLFSLPEDSVAAAVDEAHRAGKRVFMHPNATSDVAIALRNGVDVIAHTTPSTGSWTELPITANTSLTPTLALRHFFTRHDRASTQERMVADALAQLRTWIDKGGTVLFGTDLGAVDPNPSLEYQLMREAGMDAGAILASLTYGTRLERGATADVVAFAGDFANVRYTIRNGRVIYRK
jgi:imidazolonepropionase-like amidohydrolase